MALQSPTPHQLTVESWTFYSIGILLIAGRMFVFSIQQYVALLPPSSLHVCCS
ncbi:hypothetical protein P167DRAFT_537564 [Morchella conica CCBAS932]|uniref:Uncharacterized protein n=1 Tax=Morchella conica CCBAS932 TaxID=1392247 RepID=A0A3N4KM21_9PEZI|nr:hypothetical protein P167DRAFT_537564 [Morchella conica CCBAS932]